MHSAPNYRRLASLFTLIGVCASAYAVGYPATPEDLRGMGSLVCSGVLVRMGRGAEQPAVLLTNGHCSTHQSIDPDDAVVDVAYERGEISLFVGGETPELVKPSRVLYATRTGTDIGLIELKSTYRALEAKGARVYEISETDAQPGSDIQLVSGFWKQKQLCAISHMVGSLVEDAWTTRDSFAMKDPCPSQGGWSGTPMLDPTTMKVVGLLSTTNTAGQLCTLDNPCEVDAEGNRLAFNGRSYGQRTSPILECVNPSGDIDLGRPGCKLTKPKIRGSTPKPEPSKKPAPAPSPAPDKPSTSIWPKSKRS